MITRHFEQGGLWESDILAFKKDPTIKNLVVKRKIDGHHLTVEYDQLIQCEECGEFESITMAIGKTSYCREYECHACNRRWVDPFDDQIFHVPGGKEILKEFNSGIKTREDENDV